MAERAAGISGQLSHIGGIAMTTFIAVTKGTLFGFVIAGKQKVCFTL